MSGLKDYTFTEGDRTVTVTPKELMDALTEAKP